jgi:hypothetical protein
MNKQTKNLTRAILAAFLAANTTNAIAIHRGSGVVIGIEAGDGQNGSNNVRVAVALVGTGDRFKKWEGVALVLSRLENFESIPMRTTNEGIYGILELLFELNHNDSSMSYSDWEYLEMPQ